MANLVYNRLSYNLMKKLVDLSSDTIKCALVRNTYTPDPDHNVWADVSGNESYGIGYTSGGKALTGQTVTQDDDNDKGVFDADDIVWTTCSAIARYGVLYDVTVSDNLICLVDFGGDKDGIGADFYVVWHEDGILTLSLMVVC